MLSDKTILERINIDNLIHEAAPSNIRNCTYTLRVGSVFQPESGAKEDKPPELKPGSQPQHWIIGPTECLIVRTKEILNIPLDLCAYYDPLNRLAQKGVMLLNASVIEPGYSGPLSCFLVNFSSHDVEIAAEQEIAKITFHTLDNAPATPLKMAIEGKDYDLSLSNSARRFEKSFLGIGSIEERATTAAKESVVNSLKLGAGAAAFLVLFAQFEPLFSKWVWEKSGLITATQRVDALRLEKDLEIAQMKLKLINDALNDPKDAKAKILKAKLSEIESNTTSRDKH